MIKREINQNYNFIETMNHSEDLCFYLSISKNRIYDYTSETILVYRKRSNSAMTDYVGLENGYYKLNKYIVKNFNLGKYQKYKNKIKMIKIMFLIHLIKGKSIKNAFKCMFRYLIM